MTPAQERVVTAAIDLAEAGHRAGFEPVSSMALHQLYDAVAALKTEPALGATGQFPDGKLNPNDEGELKMQLSHNEQLVRVDFGKPTAWIAMPKAQALTFAFAVLDHCGVKIEMQQVPGTPADPV